MQSGHRGVGASADAKSLNNNSLSFRLRMIQSRGSTSPHFPAFSLIHVEAVNPATISGYRHQLNLAN